MNDSGAPQGSTERPGHKYVRRWWDNGKWQYDYTGEKAEAHGAGAVPEIYEKPYKVEITNPRTGETTERAAFQVVPKSHTVEVAGATEGVEPEKAYRQACITALSQPGTAIPVRHSRMGADCTLVSEGDGKLTLRRNDNASESLFSKNGEGASKKSFSSYAAYEHWFLQTSNTQTINDPEGRPWFNIIPVIGKVNTKDNKIDWSTDPERQYKVVYHPSFPEELQKKDGGVSRAVSLAHAKKLLDDEYGAIEETLGRTPTRGKLAVVPSEGSDTPKPKPEPEKTETKPPLDFNKLPPMDDVLSHSSMKWKYNYATRDRELDVTPQQKTALVQHAAKQYWPKLVQAADRMTNTPFFEGNKREVMSEWIGQDLPDSRGTTPDHVFLMPDSVGYKAIESALDNFDPNKAGVNFTGYLAGKNGKINNYFLDAQRAATDKQSRISGSSDDDEGVDQISRRGATEEEREQSAHLQTPEERAESQQHLDPKVVLPRLTQVLMRWEQTKPEKAAIIAQAKTAMRAIRTAPEHDRADMVSQLLEKLSDAGMGKDLGLVKSWETHWIITLAEQQSVLRKALQFLTRDKNVDPTHEYDHREGDDDNPRFYYKDQSGNLLRYTNAPTGDPDRADFYGDAKLHQSEPLYDKNPEYFTPDGRKLTRCPDCDPSQVEWNSKYNRYDPKNLWVGRWRDPNTGEFRFTYVHADIRQLPKLAINQQNALVDSRLPGLRTYYSDLFNKSDKLKDQMTAVALALLDQGKVRAVELAALTPDQVVIDGSLVSLGSRKVYVDAKMLTAFVVMKNTTPSSMPLFSVASQGREKIDPNVRRMMGPHYLSRVLDMQGVSLLGLQTYHASGTFAREVERLLSYYHASWDQAVNQALMTVALEWGHDFSTEPDPLRVLQLVQEVLVDPVVVQVLQQNAKARGVIGSAGAAELPAPTIPVPYVTIDLTDRTADEAEFSQWIHGISLHDYAEIPTDVGMMKAEGTRPKAVSL